MSLPPVDFPFINEEFDTAAISPAGLDVLLADGWRHFGRRFFRYSLAVHDDEIRIVTPLRIAADLFAPSKSQRRILRANESLHCSIGPLAITREIEELFERHSAKFRFGRPGRIDDILSREQSSPTDCLQLCVREHKSGLIAASFFDVGAQSVSSIYGIFDLTSDCRSLGIFTILKELEYARKNKKRFLYPGYAYRGRSFYDYKKRFSATEYFDWNGNWRPLDQDEL